MAFLQDNPTLKDLQQYMADVCQERGWTKDSPPEKFLLFVEEVGELAKAMRNSAGMYQEAAKAPDVAKRELALQEEFADVLSYLLDLANAFNVDLEQAFRAKEAVNQTRKWD